MPQSRKNKRNLNIGTRPYIQTINEPPTIKQDRTIRNENGEIIGRETITIPNPNYGKTRTIQHNWR